MFATRADLLARSNALHLAQLAVPTDVEMISDAALRAAIAGHDLTSFSTAEQNSIALALEKIDRCLADADDLMVSYGITAGTQSMLLARIGATIALYYLHGEDAPEGVQKAYDAQIKLLTAAARGDVQVGTVPGSTTPSATDPGAWVEANPRRYASNDAGFE